MLRFSYIRKDPYGVVTVAYFYKPEERLILAGFSFCSPFDMFNANLGREIAINRLEKFCLSISDLVYMRDDAQATSDKEETPACKNAEKVDFRMTFLEYIKNVLEKNKNLRNYLGVRLYKNWDEPLQQEQFRWWLKKLIDIVEYEVRIEKNMRRVMHNMTIVK